MMSRCQIKVSVKSQIANLAHDFTQKHTDREYDK